LPSKQVSLVLFLVIFKYITLIIVCDRHSAMTYYNFGNNKGKQILYTMLTVVQITGIIK
jgi:hypothetical protein